MNKKVFYIIFIILFIFGLKAIYAANIIITPTCEENLQSETNIWIDGNLDIHSSSFSVTYNGNWLKENYKIIGGCIAPTQLFFSSLDPLKDILNETENEYKALVIKPVYPIVFSNEIILDGSNIESITVNYGINWAETLEQTNYVENYASQKAQELCNEQMSDYDKIRALHNFIINNFYFDEDTLNNYPYQMTSGDKSGSSKAFAGLTWQLLEYAGIESRIVMVNSIANFEGNPSLQDSHYWNLVNLDGNWYHIDTAWDDYVTEVNGGDIRYDYFLKGSNYFRVTHSWDETRYPASNSNYYKTPIITIESYNTNPTNQNITVYATTDIGVLNEESHTFTENGSFEFVATNGNSVKYHTVTITNIDKTPPIISVGNYNTEPTNQNITLCATVNEGVLNTSNIIACENGSYSFIAEDLAGNITTKTINITNIDKTPPTVTGVKNNQVYNKNMLITFNEGTAKLNGEKFYSGTTVSTERSHNLVVTDLAGNETVLTFIIDKTAPKVTGVEDGKYYNSNVTISFDEGTAKLNGINFISGSTVSAENNYKLVVTDTAGNVKQINFTLDKTAPMVSGAANKVYYKNNVVITFNEGSAKLNGDKFYSGSTVSTERSHNLVVTDLAGNTTVITFTIDKTPPKISGVADKASYDTYVIILFNEGNAKLNGKAFTSGGKVSNEGNYTLIVTDLAGNTASLSFTIGTLKIKSNKYQIDEISGVIKNIGIGVSATDFKSNLDNSSSQIKIYRADGSENTSGVVGTGMSVKLVVDGNVRQTLKIVVLGDIDGNGKITITDMLKIKAVLLKKGDLTGEYAIAGDVNKDGKITITDFIKVKADILNKEKINAQGFLPLCLALIIIFSLIIHFNFNKKEYII